MGRESFLDVLRFLAAATVVVFHFGFRGYSADSRQDVSYVELAWFSKYGYLGVNLFFMISGYVIPLSIRNRSIYDFVLSRAIRLYPTFWLCAAFSYAVLIAMGDHRFYISPYDAIVNLTMVPTWFGSPYIDGVYWTLAIELQFYALVAIVVGLFGFRKLPDALMAWLFIGAMASVLTIISGHRIAYLGGNYYMYFCFGAACYFVHNERSIRIYAMLIISFALLLSQGIVRASSVTTEFGSKIEPSVVCCILLACACAVFFTRSISLKMKYPALTAFIGGLTYPLYLIHENVGYSMLNTFFSQETRWHGIVLVIALNLAVAAVVYAFFDKPVRSKLSDLRKRRFIASQSQT